MAINQQNRENKKGFGKSRTKNEARTTRTYPSKGEEIGKREVIREKKGR